MYGEKLHYFYFYLLGELLFLLKVKKQVPGMGSSSIYVLFLLFNE